MVIVPEIELQALLQALQRHSGLVAVTSVVLLLLQTDSVQAVVLEVEMLQGHAGHALEPGHERLLDGALLRLVQMLAKEGVQELILLDPGARDNDVVVDAMQKTLHGVENG